MVYDTNRASSTSNPTSVMSSNSPATAYDIEDDDVELLAYSRPDSQYKEFFDSLKNINVSRSTFTYLKSLFPIAGWLPRYNTTWLIGDLVAGITVALVVIPQVPFPPLLTNIVFNANLNYFFSVYCLFYQARYIARSTWTIYRFFWGANIYFILNV